MKAYILAAGPGTRLRPLTNTIPKCLVPINGKALLAYHLESLEAHGIYEIGMTARYLAEQVEAYVEEYGKAHKNMKIKFFYEPELLGSAGSLRYNQDFFAGEEYALVLHADNFTNINYSRFIAFHKEKKGLASIACYYEEHPESKGVVLCDENNKIFQFIEKPKKELISTHNANGGMYIFNKEIFTYLAELNANPLDFGNDVFPYLLEKRADLYAYIMTEFLLDIGTPETYAAAQEKVKELHFDTV